jgi:hypothetical protein
MEVSVESWLGLKVRVQGKREIQSRTTPKVLIFVIR